MQNPVNMRIKNQSVGSRNKEWSKIAIDASEASAAKTRICPTRSINNGITIENVKINIGDVI